MRVVRERQRLRAHQRLAALLVLSRHAAAVAVRRRHAARRRWAAACRLQQSVREFLGLRGAERRWRELLANNLSTLASLDQANAKRIAFFERRAAILLESGMRGLFARAHARRLRTLRVSSRQPHRAQPTPYAP